MLEETEIKIVIKTWIKGGNTVHEKYGGSETSTTRVVVLKRNKSKT